ncbi:MAG: hypothetical protein ABI598_02150 [Chloroflexota bacterium]
MSEEVETAAGAAGPAADTGTDAAADTGKDPVEAAETSAASQSKEGAGRESGELNMVMSPRQIIGGFALMAALIVMLRRRLRGRD